MALRSTLRKSRRANSNRCIPVDEGEIDRVAVADRADVVPAAKKSSLVSKNRRASALTFVLMAGHGLDPDDNRLLQACAIDSPVRIPISRYVRGRPRAWSWASSSRSCPVTGGPTYGIV